MKKLFAFAISILLLISLAGCGGSGSGTSNSGTDTNKTDSTSNISGSLEEVTGKIIEKANETLTGYDKFPTPYNNPVTETNVEGELGLTVEQFKTSVKSALSAKDPVMNMANEIILIECNDAAAAADVKKWIIVEGGYDPYKWICAWPEQSLVITSGQYVFLVSSSVVRAEALLQAFKDMAGSTGDLTIFFESDGIGEEGGIDFTPGPAPLN